MGVLLTKRDTFLTKAEYMQLVYLAGIRRRPCPLPAASSSLSHAPLATRSEPV